MLLINYKDEIMKNKLKIKQQFVVDGKIFKNKDDAQKYIENIEKEQTKNEYNNTVYYQNWTTDGNEGERSIVRARWQTYREALDDMKNYANAYCSYGTGWIEKVTVETKNHRVYIETKRVYEKRTSAELN